MPASSTVSSSTAAPSTVDGAAAPVLYASGAARLVIRLIIALANRYNPYLPDSFRRGSLPKESPKVAIDRKPFNDPLAQPPYGNEQAGNGTNGPQGRMDSSMGMDP